MPLFRLKAVLGQLLKIDAVVRDDCALLLPGKVQLFCICFANLPRLLCSQYIKTARFHQAGKQYIDIFIKVKRNKQ